MKPCTVDEVKKFIGELEQKIDHISDILADEYSCLSKTEASSLNDSISEKEQIISQLKNKHNL